MKGFSLIELLVTMSIVMVVIGGIIANYDKFNRRQVLKQAAQTLKNDLRLAQNAALSSKKPNAGCSRLLGYRVTFAPGSYAIQASCIEGLVGSAATVNLPTGITFVSLPNPINFGVLTQGIDANVTITMTNTAFSYTISLSRSGDINDLGFQ